MTATPQQNRRRPLSPHEIRNTRIRQIGFRKGYDPGEVEALLHRLAEEVAARDGQLTMLAAENERLQRELYARRHGQLPSASPQDLDQALIARQLQAQRYVEELMAAAQTNAASLVSQSKHQAREIVLAAKQTAEQAVREYRASAGASYSPDREELTRLATLAQWAIRQFSGLRSQVDATDDAARQELALVLDRLAPLLQPRQPAPQTTPKDESWWTR
jgi:DivIVA domain-containing protein